MTSKTRSSRLTTTAVALLAVAGILAGCGGNTGRPTVQEISELLREDDGGITQEQADCVAEEIVGSEVSDEGLRTLVESNETDIENIDVSEEDVQAFTDALLGSLETCSLIG